MSIRSFLVALACLLTAAAPAGVRSERPLADSVRQVVDATILPLMAKDDIAGMAVGVAVDGRSYVFDYGLASKKPRVPVTGETLFELGSLSKTFTATAAAWAQEQHRLYLGDAVKTYVPELAGTPFGDVNLIALGTHTPGGLPLQVPDTVANDSDLIRYLSGWRPTYASGTYRTYSNISIGMLGIVTGKSVGEDFRIVAQQRLFPALGLNDTFIDIPEHKLPQYAWGYSDDGKPTRMHLGVLWHEAYGVRTTAADMIHFVQENIDPSNLPAALRQAVTETHRGYFQAGPMTQDLIWEQYPFPVALSSLLDGNAYKMIFDATPVRAIVPPEAPHPDVWLNKTGSTNGFGAYAAFVPSERLGIVLLANRSYPIPDRVAAAYRMLGALANSVRKMPST